MNMNLFFICTLFIFWTLFWSFASVLIYRIKSWEWGIWWGRSHCKTCQRNLSVLELIPIFSWVIQRGKCASCSSKISPIYPLLELTTGVLFSCVWIFLISPELIALWDILEWWRLLFFCFLIFLTIIYVFYDILYLEIPESILMIANVSVLWALIFQSHWYTIIPYLAVWNIDTLSFVFSLSVLAVMYTIIFAGLSEIYDCLLLWVCYACAYLLFHFFALPVWDSALVSGVLAALVIYSVFFLQIVVSGWRAMGAGDLRIAILMWLVCWLGFIFPAFMICYLVGSIVWIGMILVSKIYGQSQGNKSSQIAFWPFIACGYISVLFFSSSISRFIEWYIY